MAGYCPVVFSINPVYCIIQCTYKYIIVLKTDLTSLVINHSLETRPISTLSCPINALKRLETVDKD